MDKKELQLSFLRLDTKTQNYLLKAYCAYVNGYPESHDEGSYPACFFEWWQNDHPEMLEKEVDEMVMLEFGAL